MNNGFIIGITGISGSGKTLLSKELIKNIEIDKLIHVDDYWKDHKSIPKSISKWREWERPMNINFDKLFKDLIKLKKKRYTILSEGFYLFYKKEIRNIIDFKIYIDLPNNLMIKRRIDKFSSENNQEFYCKEIVIKEYRRYGLPTRKYADLILNGTKKIKINSRKILKRLFKIKQPNLN